MNVSEGQTAKEKNMLVGSTENDETKYLACKFSHGYHYSYKNSAKYLNKH